MHTKSALASLLLVSAVNGHAQTLGAAQGSVIIGRPLDIVVQSPGLASDDAAALCLQAEVRYGETRLGRGDVSVTVARDVAVPGLRVRARPPVDEPYVILQLALGCNARFMRQYTLLAAPPEAVGLPTLPVPFESRLSAVEAGHDTSVDEGSPKRSADVIPKGIPVRARVQQQSVKRQSPPWFERLSWNSTGSSIDFAGTGGGPRLKVQPIAFSSDEEFLQFLLDRARRDLGGDNAANEGSVSSDQTRQGKADADVVERTSALQQEVLALREERERLRQDVERLSRELTQTQSGFTVREPYVVGAIATIVLATLAWLFRDRLRRFAFIRPRAKMPWWIVRNAEHREATDTQSKGSDVGGASVRPVPLPSVADDFHFPNVESFHTNEVPIQNKVGSSVQLDPSTGTGSEIEPPLIALDMAALHDLWERVDFFESLGQAGDAIAALSAFVRAHPRASEAPYLRWWTLARRHGLDTRTLQTLYEQHYHRLLVVDDADTVLEGDAALTQALTATWPGEQARAIVVAALASQPGDPGSPLHVRTLAAFDDLITLHGVLDLLPMLGPMPEAAAMKAAGDAAPGAAAAASAALAPAAAGLDFELPDIAEVVPPSEAVGDTASATPGADEGLDFDLSGWAPPAESKEPPRG